MTRLELEKKLGFNLASGERAAKRVCTRRRLPRRRSPSKEARSCRNFCILRGTTSTLTAFSSPVLCHTFHFRFFASTPRPRRASRRALFSERKSAEMRCHLRGALPRRRVRSIQVRGISRQERKVNEIAECEAQRSIKTRVALANGACGNEDASASRRVYMLPARALECECETRMRGSRRGSDALASLAEVSDVLSAAAAQRLATASAGLGCAVERCAVPRLP